MIESACRGGRIDEFTRRKLNVEPQTRDGGVEIRQQRSPGSGGHHPVLRVIGQPRGEQRSLEPFGLRPESSIRIVDREVVEQRVDGNLIVDAELLADRNQPEGHLPQGTWMEALGTKQ
jgi:hypothetical protein